MKRHVKNRFELKKEKYWILDLSHLGLRLN